MASSSPPPNPLVPSGASTGSSQPDAHEEARPDHSEGQGERSFRLALRHWLIVLIFAVAAFAIAGVAYGSMLLTRISWGLSAASNVVAIVLMLKLRSQMAKDRRAWTEQDAESDRRVRELAEKAGCDLSLLPDDGALRAGLLEYTLRAYREGIEFQHESFWEGVRQHALAVQLAAEAMARAGRPPRRLRRQGVPWFVPRQEGS